MKKYLYGVDLGGTFIKFGLFNYEGELIQKFDIKTNKNNNGKDILPDIAKAIKDNISKNNIVKSDVYGVGIGVPGPVINGVVNHCVNLGWGVVNVKKNLQELLNIPVSVSNDANIAGLGELWKGSGSTYNDLVFITIGTGIGGAVIVDNKVLDGHTGASGEIGHAPTIDSDTGFLCNCGNVGCLETVASATGIVRVAKEYLNNSDEQSILRNESLKNLSAKVVFDAAKKKDSIALKTVECFGKNLGFVCATIAVVNNPQAFVFGGGVSSAGQVILDVVKKYFDKYALFAVKENTDFKLATLGNEAGFYGAAYLAKQL